MNQPNTPVTALVTYLPAALVALRLQRALRTPESAAKASSNAGCQMHGYTIRRWEAGKGATLSKVAPYLTALGVSLTEFTETIEAIVETDRQIGLSDQIDSTKRGKVLGELNFANAGQVTATA